ncbi:MAG: tRNA pseudouridine(55) synthase TruB [Marinilabiliaceae bacterium]|nr:tRNA pseudouridine(55) synthase TruB [Marinilabiliaceae bacterium]
MDFLAGEILVIDKPLGWTSFDVVNKVRYMLKSIMGIKKIKVGHAGTLDPLATGVVVLCTGKKTKSIEELMNHYKVYTATIRLGATTPSYDLEKEIDVTYPYEHITRDMVEEVLKSEFTGEIQQVPPLFSAISIGGKRAYELARKGQTEDKVRIEPRTVTINEISLLDFKLPNLKLRISCSKGTYIRSIARDLGEALHSGGHLTELRRIASGEYSADNALTMQQVEALLRNEASQTMKE